MTPIARIEHSLDRIESALKLLAKVQASSRAEPSTGPLKAVHEACAVLGARLQRRERVRRCDA
jgi:hypothetical protein